MKILMLTTFLIFSTTVSLAQNARQMELINEKRRPSIEKILSDAQNYEDYTTRDTQYIGQDAKSRVEAINTYLPQLIVSLEKVFPGGTYGFLGRDMDLIADAVETYYSTIGQTNRVKKIEFSTPSLRGSTPELMTDFLSQLGLETDRNKTKGTFVIIDYTSFNTTGRNDSTFPSQARHILQSVIGQLKKMGLSSIEILERVNIATFDRHAANFLKVHDPLLEASTDFISKQAEALDARGQIDRILFLPAGDQEMAYYSEWNGKYGPIKRSHDGRLITEPESYFEYIIKNGVYNYMVKVINHVLSKDMSDRISKLAEKHGVIFSSPKLINTKTQFKIVKPAMVDYDGILEAGLGDKVNSLTSLPAEKQYDKVKVGNATIKLTENGSQVLKILVDPTSVQAAHYFEISLGKLMALVAESKIGVRDFRRIFDHILSLKKITDPGIFEMIRKNYKNTLSLEIMFGREDEREKYSKQGGLAEQNYKAIIEGANLKLSCQFAYSGT